MILAYSGHCPCHLYSVQYICTCDAAGWMDPVESWSQTDIRSLMMMMLQTNGGAAQRAACLWSWGVTMDMHIKDIYLLSMCKVGGRGGVLVVLFFFPKFC